MGWEVIAKCYIDCLEVKTEEVHNKIQELAKKHGESLIDYSKSKGFIGFELSGNKMIGYEILEELTEWFKENKIQGEISANEYVESGGCGYYWDGSE